MELKKIVLATAVFGALGGLYGCSGDENATITIDDNSVTEDNSMVIGGPIDVGTPDDDFRPDDDAAISAAIASLPGSFERPVTLLNPETGNEVTRTAVAMPANILADVTLDSDVIYVMTDRVTVGNGNQTMTATDGVLESGDDLIEVTLTIEPGTLLLGARGTFANLLITRGSDIMAMGTAAAPIIMASDDPGFEGAGEWGGLVIHGYGLHNQCEYVGVGGTPPATDQPCNIDSEGESGFSGGHDNTDSSGVLNYVIVTEGGYEFNPGDEINGISLVAVGSGTEIDFVQINSNADDGIEFFGGDVNASHLVLTGNQDDSVDWDEGFTGNLQYILVRQTPDSQGTTIEADTEGTTLFLSEPTILNATFISDGSQSVSHALRATSGGYIHQSIITGASGAVGTCVSLGSGSDDNAADGSIVYNEVLADCTTFETDGSMETTILATNGNANLIQGVAASLDTNYASTAAEATGITPVVPSDFSPVAEDEYFDDTTFLGAVNPDGSDLWFEGWVLDGTL